MVFGFWPAKGFAGPVVWSEGFENGLPPGANGSWSVIGSPASAHSGSYGADIDGPTGTNGDILFLPTPSTGYQNLGFEFWSKIRTGDLEANDQVVVEWTPDGVNWATLITDTDQAADDWQFATLDLPAAADDNPALALRLWANLSSSGDRMNFNDFVLTGQPIPEPTAIGLLAIGALAFLRRRYRYQAR